MATYVLIHGAGDSGWYWHLLEMELRNRGHDVVAPDLPSEDNAAGLPEYADVVVDAIGDRSDLVVVAHSFGGFTAPLVCDRAPVDLLVLLAGMVPLPGEPPDDWWPTPGTRRHGASRTNATAGRQTTSPCFSTTSRRTWRRRRCGGGGTRPPPRGRSRGRCGRGRTCRPGSCCVATAVSSLPSSYDCVALSRPKDLADRLEAYRAER